MLEMKDRIVRNAYGRLKRFTQFLILCRSQHGGFDTFGFHVIEMCIRDRYRLLPSGLQHGACLVLGQKRRAGPRGYPRNPPYRRALRVLGLSARALPEPADRQLRERRPADRSEMCIRDRICTRIRTAAAA